MKPKHIAWAVGTFFLTLQGCTEAQDYEQEQEEKILMLDADFLKSRKGEPSEIKKLSTPDGEATVCQVIYEYTEGTKRIRTSLFVVDADHNDTLRVPEIKSSSRYIRDMANQIESTLEVDQDEIIYKESHNFGPVTTRRTQNQDMADKKLQEVIDETLYDIIPKKPRIVLASNIAQP